jgi:hypothetical protein
MSSFTATSATSNHNEETKETNKVNVTSTSTSNAIILLYTNVINAELLPPAIGGVLIDLAYVVSHLHLESALHKVLYNKNSRKKMSTDSIGANICYALSSSKKMSETQKKYMVSSMSTNVAYILVDPTDEYLQSLKVSISDKNLAVEVTDTAFVESLMTPEKATELIAAFKISPHELKVGSLEDAILMKIAVKESM